MKNLTLFLSLFLFLTSFEATGKEETKLASLYRELSIVNQARKTERMNAEELHAQLERGEIDEAVSDRAYRQIELRVSRLNTRKAALESAVTRIEELQKTPKIMQQGSSEKLSEQHSDKEGPVQPPNPLLMWGASAAFGLLITVGKWAIFLIGILVVGWLVVVFIDTPPPTSKPTLNSVNQPNRIHEDETVLQYYNPNLRPAQRLHSGEMPDHLI